jgi:L-threonylcarbamoyladenylate synthase
VSSAVEEAVAAVRAGRLVVLPTDTVYGIGCDPSKDEAVDRVFAAKERPRDLVLPVLVDGFETAERLGRLDVRARAMAEAFWPGALTLVLRRAPDSGRWTLGDERDTIGLRVPAAPTALEVLRRSGPLAMTSANRSGESTPDTCDGVRAVFGSAVASYVCADHEIGGRASTVVDVSGPEARILREGDLTERIRALL